MKTFKLVAGAMLAFSGTLYALYLWIVAFKYLLEIVGTIWGWILIIFAGLIAPVIYLIEHWISDEFPLAYFLKIISALYISNLGQNIFLNAFYDIPSKKKFLSYFFALKKSNVKKTTISAEYTIWSDFQDTNIDINEKRTLDSEPYDNLNPFEKNQYENNTPEEILFKKTNAVIEEMEQLIKENADQKKLIKNDNNINNF